MKVIINDFEFDLVYYSERYEILNGHKRKTITLSISGSSYDYVSKYFVDDSTFVIVDDDGVNHTRDEYTISGPITDNRDGTLLVKMGVANTKEQDLQEQIDQLSKIVTKIAGKPVSTIDEAGTIRSDMESVFLAADMDDDEKIHKSYLCPVWSPGVHKVGEIYTVDSIIWECFQAYDNSIYPDIAPGNSAWFTFNRPLHGTTPETAQPWIKPQGSHDMYHIGEYMIYINGLLYKCIFYTNYSPEEYSQAWEMVKQ